jgi:polysaccharide deacetylase 2 family uncharacterized protein YibQ
MIKLYLISIRRKRIVCFFLAVSIIVTGIKFISASGVFSIDTVKGKHLRIVDSDLSNAGCLAIIIDDFGQDRAGVKEMMTIYRRLTFAVMPFLEYSQSDAEAAHKKGYEVIVHLPMEPNHGKMSWVGPRPILAGMNRKVAEQIVREAFENVPYAVGANIHMGSKASGEEDVISGILDVIKEKDMYFVDSRTADKPISKELADTKRVLCFERDIFIDEGRTKEGIKKQLKKTEEIISRKGKAVVIGHVGPEGGKATAEAISEMLPEFDRKNIRLVFVSELSDN